MKELKRYISYIGKYSLEYWSIFIITIVTSVLLNLAYPYMNKLIFNAIEYGSYELFVKAAILCGVLVILNCLSPYRRYFQMRVVRKIVFDIKIRLFHKLMQMDVEYYEKNHSGEALKTLNWDANSLKDSYFSHIYWVVIRIVNGASSIIAMLVYNPVLMIVSVTFSIVTVFISVRVNAQIKKMDKEIQKKLSKLAARLSDILSGFTLLKMYSGSSIVLDNYQSENEQVTKDENRRVNKAALLEMVAFLLGILGSFGTIAVGAIMVSKGKMDYGTVMAVVYLQMNVSYMVQSFGSALTTFSNSLVKAGRVFDFLENDSVEEEILEGKSTGVDGGCESAIIFENVSFGYNDEKNVFSDFNMNVNEAERVMVMGESGCGKSTLLKMLMRFYEKREGNIRIFGKNIEDYSLTELRNMITYIPQNSYLFEGTVRENIEMGYPDDKMPSEGEIKAAAKAAYADEFISEFADGYEQHLDAGGTNLSGGQRQRIAIARAFLKNSPILLMDEPSSALDVESEKKINCAMKELMKGKVVIMVTHRATSFEDFNRVIKI